MIQNAIYQFQSQGENDRAARTVRQLLAKHQENINQTLTQSSDSNSSSPKNSHSNSPNTVQGSSGNSHGKAVLTSKANQDTNGHVFLSSSSPTSSYIKKVSKKIFLILSRT